MRKLPGWHGPDQDPPPQATLAASVAAMPGPSSHLANTGTGTFRRTESSITMELV
jgi:hypothetical protein